MYYDLTNTDQLSEDAYARLLEELPPQRREKTCKLLFDRDRRASASVWALLRHAVMQEHGIDVNTLVVSKEAYGKPVFSPENGIHFNLSHSKSAVMCAVSDAPVGCDVQTYQELPLYDASLEQHILCPDEQAVIDPVQGESRRKMLTLFWVAKEAITKHAGTGLTTDVRKFNFSRPVAAFFETHPLEENVAPFAFKSHGLTFSLYTKAGAAFCACSEKLLKRSTFKLPAPQQW